MKKAMKRLVALMAIIGLAFILFVVWFNIDVTKLGTKYSYNSFAEIPHNHCAVVLGTSKYLSAGKENLFYTNRIKAAVELYKNKKVDYIIVSGDNRHESYNEPRTMYNDLANAGIPKDRIILDFAGFRTLDSIIRCYKVFGQRQFTVISQPFHNHRAVYIGRKKGINVIAYNAGDVAGTPTLKVTIREIGARTLLAYDMLVGKQPHFLGEEITIPE
jgi:SanA protein